MNQGDIKEEKKLISGSFGNDVFVAPLHFEGQYLRSGTLMNALYFVIFSVLFYCTDLQEAAAIELLAVSTDLVMGSRILTN